MSITKEKKEQQIKDYARTPTDTGSPEVQVAVLTERILNMSQHMKTHKKDLHSEVGLLRMVSRRRRLLKYLKRVAQDRYLALIGRLGLRH